MITSQLHEVQKLKKEDPMKSSFYITPLSIVSNSSKTALTVYFHVIPNLNSTIFQQYYMG